MDRGVAEGLLPIVNDLVFMAAILKYMEDRVAYYHGILEISGDVHEITRAQGAIRELKRWTTIRDEIQKVRNEKGNQARKEG